MFVFYRSRAGLISSLPSALGRGAGQGTHKLLFTVFIYGLEIQCLYMATYSLLEHASHDSIPTPSAGAPHHRRQVQFAEIITNCAEDCADDMSFFKVK